MATPRIFQSAVLILSLSITLLFTFPTHAAITPPANSIPAQPSKSSKCTLPDLHRTVAEWHAEESLLIDGYRKFSNLLKNLHSIESRLATKCDILTEHRQDTRHFLETVKLIADVPNLKHFLKPIRGAGEHLEHAVLKKPLTVICKTATEMHKKIGGIAHKLREAHRSKVSIFLNRLETAHGTLERVLKEHKNNGEKHTNCLPFNGLCTSAKKASVAVAKFVKDIEELLEQSNAFRHFLETVDGDFEATTDIINRAYAGPARDVITRFRRLVGKEVSLPIPVTRKRGAGELPSCCPHGHTLEGGLCYTPCRAGYEPLHSTCMERCQHGWKDIGASCTRTVMQSAGFFSVPVPEFHPKDIYGRSGKNPTDFGNSACSCRRDKRYLDHGLCYNKCGKDHLEGFDIPFRGDCVALKTTSVTIVKLAEHLDLFSKAEKIEELRNALMKVNGVIAKEFVALIGPTRKSLSIPKPPLKVPQGDDPKLSVLEEIGEVLDVGIFDQVEREAQKLSIAILRNRGCKN